MAKSLDYHILPLYRREDTFQAKIPGLYVAQPPRRVNRHRSDEQVVFYLTLEGNAPLSEDAYRQLLEATAKVYYQSTGSITSALRSVTETLNKYLLDRNLRGSSRGIRAIGSLTQVVLRGSTVFIAQSGPTHLFVVKAESAKRFHDPNLTGRGLGMGRVPKVRFFQEQLEADDHLLITNNPPPVWTGSTLKNLPRMQMKGKYFRLIHRVEKELNAVLVVAKSGSGNIHLVKPEMKASPTPEADFEQEVVSEKDQGLPEPLGVLRGILGKEDEEAPEPSPSPPRSEQGEDKPPARPQPVPEQDTDQRAEPRQPEPESSRVSAPPSPTRDSLGEKVRDLPIRQTLTKAFHTMRKGIRTGWKSISQLLGRTLPAEAVPDFPGWVKGVIAVAVPIVVVIVASVVYMDRGIAQEYQNYYEQASTLAREADSIEDPGLRYAKVKEAFTALEQARRFRETEESQELYEELREELDTFNLVKRISFDAVVDLGLGDGAFISEMVVNSFGDIYVLDKPQGTVYRIASNAGYQVDPSFSCGPIMHEGSTAPLVDIVPLPGNFENGASILAVDANHNMVFCYPGPKEQGEPFQDESYKLEKGPVKEMTVSAGEAKNVYILDPIQEAIHILSVFKDYQSGLEYFGEYDPPFMLDIVDLASNGNELLLLHQNGKITRCTRPDPDGGPICEFPYQFTDERPGRTPGPEFEGAEFTSLKLQSHMGLSLYMLDPAQQAVYRFNPQLVYQEQYRPTQTLPGGGVTAFALGLKDELYLVVGDQVYMGELR